jgi:Peptidase family M48
VPILVQCAHCQEKYQVSSSALGKQAKCAKCGQRFPVVELKRTNGSPSKTRAPAQQPATAKTPAQQPASTAANKVAAAAAPDSAPKASKSSPAAQTRGRLTERELLAAFREPFPRSRPRITYRFGILLVAATMIILPLIYLAFIALVGFGVYSHAMHHAWLLNTGHGRSRIFFVLAFAGPLIAGPIAVFFMFKPLLARPSKQEHTRSLTRQSEPLLFAFIDRICQDVGAPLPRRIDVDCNVNASASFRRGVLSMFGRDLVLTIGLPLAAGLTLREFGGVMAHELGHFAQGAGMRMSYLVRSIVHWFLRVVYQRDQWDDWLTETSNDLDIRVGWIFLVAQLFVCIGRGLLWILLHVGFTISGLMLRQMEFDADSYETRFAGSTAFGSTVKKLHLLGGATTLAQAQLTASLDYRKLVDNLPGLILYHARQMSRECMPLIEKDISESKTGWFDSHPCDKDRIAAAEKLACTGIFRSDRPAGDLFNDFAAQSAAATWDLYLGIFGPKVPRTALQPLQQFLTESKAGRT